MGATRARLAHQLLLVGSIKSVVASEFLKKLLLDNASQVVLLGVLQLFAALLGTVHEDVLLEGAVRNFAVHKLGVVVLVGYANDSFELAQVNFLFVNFLASMNCLQSARHLFEHRVRLSESSLELVRRLILNLANLQVTFNESNVGLAPRVVVLL